MYRSWCSNCDEWADIVYMKKNKIKYNCYCINCGSWLGREDRNFNWAGYKKIDIPEDIREFIEHVFGI